MWDAVRRIALTSAHLLLSHEGADLQIVVCLFIALTSAKLLSLTRPQLNTNNYILADIAETALCIFLLVTMLLYFGVVSRGSGLAWFLITLNLLVVLVAFRVIYRDYIAEREV